MESMQENDISDLNEGSSIDEDLNDIWKPKRYDSKKFWFLKQSEDVPEGTYKKNTKKIENIFKLIIFTQVLKPLNRIH